MKMYYAGRCAGKTKRCILELTKDPNTVLLVFDNNARGMVVKNNKGIKDIENRVFSSLAMEVMRGLNPKCSIIIDNIDAIAKMGGLNELLRLAQTHGIKLATATMSEANISKDNTVTITI